MLCTYKWNPTFPASATSGKNVNNYVLKYLLGSFSFYLQEAKKNKQIKKQGILVITLKNTSLGM